MQPGETIGTAQFDGLTAIDAARWAFALVVVAAFGLAGVLLTRHWTPPTGEASIAEAPTIMLELSPMPEPEVAMEPAPPPPEPTPPTILPDPPPPAPVEPVMQEPNPLPVPEPVVEPPPEPKVAEAPPEPAPEPVPEPEVLPEPVPEAEAPAVVLPMPATMSADLRQRRLDTPATPRPQRQPARPKPTVQPAATPAAAPPPAVAAPGPSPEQWQQQVLAYLDRRKLYPREAQRAGQEGVARITFAIDSAGRVLSVSLAGSSGIAALDQAALNTVRRASPLPSPPADMGQGSLTLTASIRFTLR